MNASPLRRIANLAILTILCATLVVPSVSAIGTAPSTPPLVSGPFIISAYGFSGDSLLYAQIANESSRVVSLDGWRIETRQGENVQRYPVPLGGHILPHHKVTVADTEAMPAATFTYERSGSAAEALLDAIVLVAPGGSGYDDHSVNVTIKSSMPRDISTTPVRYYFARNISSATGDYLSTFTASDTIPSVLASDPLYEPPLESALRIVELYPRASNCSPASASPLCYDYVKVHNQSASAVIPGEYRVRAGGIDQSATASNTAQIAEVVQPGDYSVVRLNLTDGGSFAWIEDGYGLVNYRETSVGYESSASNIGEAWSYDRASGVWRWTQYPTPANTPNDFGPVVPVNECSGLKLSEIAANHTPQYIELYNASSTEITIAGCQIQTNRSATASYVFAGDQSLAAGHYQTLMIRDTELTLTKTTSGTVYVLNSTGTNEVDARTYDDLDEGTALARVGGVWQQTFNPTPGKPNQAQEYPPCAAGYARNESSGRCARQSVATTASLAACDPGQFRNPATNRCKKITASTASLTPCDPGEFRNPETNRCKKLATATASSLKPCDPGQYRNPVTNRCKSLTSTTSTLKPCEPGYERNPQTNRCRKAAVAGASVGEVGFPVQEVTEGTKAFVGWWALGGLLILGAGYATYEWRHEIASATRSLRTKISSKGN